jgi:hypothetical protein
VGLASGVDLGAEVGSGGARLREVAGEDGLEEGSEDNLGATIWCQSVPCKRGKLEYLRSLGKCHPEDQDKFEGVVEGYPVSKGAI